MANEEQLKIFKQGVEVWNQWREEHPDVNIDLRRANLKNKNLNGINFCGADIRGTDFQNSQLVKADFTQTKAGLTCRGICLNFFLSLILGGAATWIIFFSAVAYFGRNVVYVFEQLLPIDKFPILLLSVLLTTSCILAVQKDKVAAKKIAIVVVAIALTVGMVGIWRHDNLSVNVGHAVISIVGVGAGVAVTMALAGTGALIFSVSMTMSIAGTIAGYVIGFMAITGRTLDPGEDMPSNLFFSIIITINMLFISVYLGWRTRHKDPQFATLLHIGVAMASLLSTKFQKTNLTNANFYRAHLKYSCFTNAILTGVYWNQAQDLQFVQFSGTILADCDVHELLIKGNGQGLSFRGKNFHGAYLVKADLKNSDLRETDLVQANLTQADITGAKLYGSSRDNWIIDEITCDYVYFDELGKERTPADRDFRPGEFEEIYKQLPTFAYYFEQGFTALDAVVMSRIVEAINEKHPEFELDLVSFDKRGQPHAVFTVLHKEVVEEALKQVTVEYEAKIKVLETERNLLDKFLTLAIKEPRTVINRLAIVEKGEITMGDKHIGRDNIELSGQAQVNQIKTGDSFHDQAQKLIQTQLPQVDHLTTKEECTAHYQLLSEKLFELRQAYIIEHDVEVKFKLKKKIEEAETDLNVIEQRLEVLEHEEA